MKPQPISSADYPAVLNALTEDLQASQAHYSIYHLLRRATADNETFVAQAPDLVWFDLVAHRDTAVIHLSRLYDSHKDSISLRTLINISPSSAGVDERRAHRARVSRTASDVAKLLALRHQVFAHRSPDAARKGAATLISSHDFRSTDIGTLLRDAAELLKRYGGKYMPLRLPKDINAALLQWRALLTFMQMTTFDGRRFNRRVVRLDGAIKTSVRAV
jgi:hypothetical protein